MPATAGAGGQPHRVLAVDARTGPVAVVPHDLGQVLVQRAAGVHDHQLHAPAHPEHGQVGGQRLGEQGQLGGVPVRAQPSGLVVRLLAVAGRVEVGAAGEQQPVEDAEQRVVVAVRRGGDDDGPAAGPLDLAHVGVRDQRGGGVPDPPAGLLDVGRDADQRTHALMIAAGPRRRGRRRAARSPVISGCHWTPTANGCRPSVDLDRLDQPVGGVTGHDERCPGRRRPGGGPSSPGPGRRAGPAAGCPGPG